MSEKETVCAVVVTYNRKDILIECLNALCNQTRPLNGIYLIDNASTDGTSEFLLQKGYISELPPVKLSEPLEKEFQILNLVDGQKILFHYVKMPENTGGAGGFHEGMKRALGKGYDWIWLMDDDTLPMPDALENLLKYKNQSDILASKVIRKDGTILRTARGVMNRQKLFPAIMTPLPEEFYLREIVTINCASFVGLLINRRVTEKVGFPDPGFFIYFDDFEYSLRLGDMLLVSRSVVVDLNAKGEAFKAKKKFLNLEVPFIPIREYWRTYYLLRNSIHIAKRYSLNKASLYLRVLWHFLKSMRDLLNIIIFQDHKLERIKIRFLPYIHGLLGKLGRRVIYEDGKIRWY